MVRPIEPDPDVSAHADLIRAGLAGFLTDESYLIEMVKVARNIQAKRDKAKLTLKTVGSDDVLPPPSA